jgi:hypothetical protein
MKLIQKMFDISEPRNLLWNGSLPSEIKKVMSMLIVRRR